MAGPIQSAVSSMLNTAAAAAVAGEHMKEQEAKKVEKASIDEEQGLLAKEQYHEAKADIAKLQAQGPKKLSDKEAAQLAFDELSNKIEAKLAMQSRAEKIMKRTGTWGGVR